MRVLISGICGFTGSTIAHSFLEDSPTISVVGCDNLSRTGSPLNKNVLESLGIQVIHADIRQQSDVDNLPPADWIIDAAANPSVLAGIDGVSSSRQLIENNLYGTVNLLEYARRHQSGFILLSTSRVYSIDALQALPTTIGSSAYSLSVNANLPRGVSENGISELFTTAPPLSLYGSTKLCSEVLALEYCKTFSLPVWVNRCGVLAGAGQFGRPDQGIFTYWINAYLRQQPLKYVGYGGLGYQVRDCMHPKDLCSLLKAQMNCSNKEGNLVYNVGGGRSNAMSLAQLTDWCSQRFGSHHINSETENRTFDVPWIVMDYGLAQKTWNWQPKISILSILEEIASHAEQYPDWLKVSAI
jgi:CDP-paratose 2-epimerase